MQCSSQSNREFARAAACGVWRDGCIPTVKSLVRLTDAGMYEQDEIWQESRYFSEAKMDGTINH